MAEKGVNRISIMLAIIITVALAIPDTGGWIRSGMTLKDVVDLLIWGVGFYLILRLGFWASAKVYKGKNDKKEDDSI